MDRLIIIGASGHGKVVADIAALNGYRDIVFLDDNDSIKGCARYPVLGKSDSAPDGEVFVAIGDSGVRRRFMEKYKGRRTPILIHPSAVIAGDVRIDDGVVVMAGAVVNPGAKIGRGTIVNTSCSVDHDCVIGDFCHIAVGAHLCGAVVVGDESWIGAGATVINNVCICGGCMIGAGAVVIRDINQSGTYVGTPAKRLS